MKPRRPSDASGTFLAGLASLLGLYLIMPMVGLGLSMSPGDWLRQLASPEVMQAVWISLTTSTIATAISLLLGLPAAWFLSRHRHGWMRHLEMIFEFPLILPPAVAGLGLLLALGRQSPLFGWLDAFGMSLPFTTAAVVLVQIFVGAPLLVKTATAGFAQVPEECEEAATVAGATPTQIFFRVALPMAWPSVLAGGIACWARALGEFGATLLFAGNFPGVTQTLPLAIYQFLERDLSDAVAASMLLIAIAFLALVLVRTSFQYLDAR